MKVIYRDKESQTIVISECKRVVISENEVKSGYRVSFQDTDGTEIHYTYIPSKSNMIEIMNSVKTNDTVDLINGIGAPVTNYFDDSQSSAPKFTPTSFEKEAFPGINDNSQRTRNISRTPIKVGFDN